MELRQGLSAPRTPALCQSTRVKGDRDGGRGSTRLCSGSHSALLALCPTSPASLRGTARLQLQGPGAGKGLPSLHCPESHPLGPLNPGSTVCTADQVPWCVPSLRHSAHQCLRTSLPPCLGSGQRGVHPSHGGAQRAKEHGTAPVAIHSSSGPDVALAPSLTFWPSLSLPRPSLAPQPHVSVRSPSSASPTDVFDPQLLTARPWAQPPIASSATRSPREGSATPLLQMGKERLREASEGAETGTQSCLAEKPSVQPCAPTSYPGPRPHADRPPPGFLRQAGRRVMFAAFSPRPPSSLFLAQVAPPPTASFQQRPGSYPEAGERMGTGPLHQGPFATQGGGDRREAVSLVRW